MIPLISNISIDEDDDHEHDSQGNQRDLRPGSGSGSHMNGLRAGAQWGQSHVLKAAFRESGFVPPHPVAATEAHGRGPPAPPPAPVPPPFPPDSFTSSPPAQRSPKHPPASTLQDAVVGPASLRFGGMGGTRG
ncbi:hypothetical protein BHE74_00007379 [Ensete ventricosum]|nr:hypothetical protein BHE74_00007379 [Ensete ventricosum]